MLVTEIFTTDLVTVDLVPSLSLPWIYSCFENGEQCGGKSVLCEFHWLSEEMGLEFNLFLPSARPCVGPRNAVYTDIPYLHVYREIRKSSA